MKTIFILLLSFFMFLNISFADTWEEVLYNPSFLGLNTVTAKTNGLVIAAGESGVVARSTDRGETWSYSLIEGKISLNCIAFSDSSNVYCAGDKGNVYHSSDDGLSWNEVKTPAVTDLKTIQFKDEKNGIITGLKGEMLRTTDGGQTWNLVELKTKNTVNSVCYSEGNVANAAGEGGLLMRSADLGATWDVIDLGITVNFHFIKSNSNNRVYLAGDSLTFLVSSDGGESWDFRTIESNYSQIYKRPQVSKMLCWDSATVWIKVIDRYTSFPKDYEYMSKDGGNTWVGNSMAGVLCPHEPCDYYFPVKDTGYAIVPQGIIFKVYFHNIGLEYQYKAINLAGSINKIVSQNGKDIIIAEDPSAPFTMFISNNYGKNWYQPSEFDTIGGKRGTPRLEDVTLTTGNIIYTLLNNTVSKSVFDGKSTTIYTYYSAYLLKSVDWGKTWKEIVFPNNIGAEKIVMNDDLNGVILMQSKRCYLRTKDGWNTWDSIPLPDTAFVKEFYSIYSLKPGNAIFICEKKDKTTAIYETTDDGVTWSSERKQAGNNYFFVNSSKALAYYYNYNGGTPSDIIKYSDDGCKTWTDKLPDNTLEHYGLKGVQLLDGKNGFAPTFSNIYYETTDGGLSWQKGSYNIPGENIVCKGFAITSPDNVFVGTGQGKLYKLTKGKVDVDDDISYNPVSGLYPNPTSDGCTLKFESASNCEALVVITDPAGKIINSYSVSLYQGSNTIKADLSSYATGVYFIGICAGADWSYNKVIKR